VLQDPPLQLAQLACRLEAQLLAKAAAQLRVQVERLRLAAAAVEGEHRQRVQPLSQRLLDHQALQLRQHLKQPPRHRRKRHRAGLAHQLERSQHPDLDRRGCLLTHSCAATADRQRGGLYRI
jgi:hypothetical protein